MTRSRIVRSSVCLLGVVLLGPSLVGQAPSLTAPPPGTPLVDADHKRMQPEEALTGGSVAVFGDQTKPGFYVYRNRFGPGQTSRPHFHDQDRYITVIKGTWCTGEGDVFRRETMVPIRTGGFMYHPAGYHHYDGSCDDQEVIVQIMGMGPVHTTPTEQK